MTTPASADPLQRTPQQVLLWRLRRVPRGLVELMGSTTTYLVPQDHGQGRPRRALRASLDLRRRAILLGKPQ